MHYYDAPHPYYDTDVVVIGGKNSAAIAALDLWRQLYERAARANHGEPDAGRRLASWARQAGFDDITPTASLWCYATPATREWWGGMWADRIVHSRIARDRFLK